MIQTHIEISIQRFIVGDISQKVYNFSTLIYFDFDQNRKQILEQAMANT